MAYTEQFNLGTTGQSANLSFRISPYAGDIAGLTFTETPASSGIYVVSGWGTTYYRDAQLFLSGSQVAGFGTHDVGDPSYAFVELIGNQTVAGVKTFSSAPISSAAAAGATELTRFGEVVKNTGNETVAGIKVFSSLPQTQTSRTYNSDRQLTDKEYVDTLFGTVIGVIQSIQKIKLIPSRLVNDQYSCYTIGACISALDTSSTRRGSIEIECIQTDDNKYIVADDENWLSNDIDMFGDNKPIIDISAYSGNSISATARLQNIYLYTTVTTAWTLTNVEFCDCDLWFGGNLTLTAPKFRGTNRIRLGTGKTLTLTNSTGTIVLFNDDITISKSGTEANMIIGMPTADLGVS